MYQYTEALNKSTEYFGGDDLAGRVFLDKYALKNNKAEILEDTPEKMHRRIAKEFARVEKTKFKNPMSEEEIFSYLDKFKYIVPQGSQMFGIGNDYQVISLSNCYVVETPEDSYAGILKTDQQLVQISKRRGGVGVDLSKLRPSGAITHNAAASSTGIASWMERFSNSIREVAQNGRRGALMETLDVKHPDIETFVTIKNDPSKVTGANISVRLSDEFLNAVDSDSDFTLQWPVDSDNPSIKRTVKAKDIWDKITHSAWSRAEPGLLFWSNIINNNAIDCYKDFGFGTESTNPSLREDTLIMTKLGIFPIRYLSENTPNIKVINHRGEWHDARCFKSGLNKQLVKITFTNGANVFCTKEHKWPILNTSNNLVNPQTGKVIKKDSISLKRMDKIPFPAFENIFVDTNCEFSKLDGFILGWNLGDGWICRHKAQNNRLQYGFIFSYEDIESGIGNTILDYTNQIAKIPSKLRQDRNSKSMSYATTDANVREKMLLLGADFKENGIPDTIWTGGKEFIRGFIDGLFSSDGYVRETSKLSSCQIVLVSAYKNLIHDTQKLLSFFGIKSNIKYSNKDGYHRYDLAICGIFVQKFSKIFTLSNKNKHQKLLNISKLSLEGEKKAMYANNRDYLVVKNVELTDIYEDVYDISVNDDTHTFLMETGITGNCSELPLCIFDSCRLLLQNLYSYVLNPFSKKAKFDWELFKKHAEISQRLMDDVIDLEIEKINAIIAKIKADPESDRIKSEELFIWSEIKKKCINGRRTGLGVTAEGDMLAALGIGYGTEESIVFVEEVHKQQKLASYRSSMEMSKEVGPFPIWNWELEKNSNFLLQIRSEDPELYENISKYGRRNIGNLTIAPAGSVSIETQTSSGIEPLFMLNPYTRRKKVNPNDKNARIDFTDPNGDSWQEFEVYHPKVKTWMEVTGETDLKKSPWYGYTAGEIDWKNRVRLQAAAQRHIDHAISSTLNLPEDVTREKVAEIYETAWKAGCKGITIYRQNCRTGVLVDKSSLPAPCKFEKRPKEMNCDVYHCKVKGEEYFVLVGLDKCGNPYEVFCGKNGIIPKSLTNGIIHRQKRGHYQLISEDEVVVESITDHLTDDGEALTRLLSMALRHDVGLPYVLQQLEKVEGDLFILSKAIARCLKKYVEDGTKIKGEACKECGSDSLVRENGCKVCKNCGSSLC